MKIPPTFHLSKTLLDHLKLKMVCESLLVLSDQSCSQARVLYIKLRENWGNQSFTQVTIKFDTFFENNNNRFLFVI